jgi:hypothetical protein
MSGVPGWRRNPQGFFELHLPATAAAPLEISVEIRVNMDVYHYCEIRNFYRA